MSYLDKYLKYKNKYIQLKNQLGGAVVTDYINKTAEVERMLSEDEGAGYFRLVKEYFTNLNNFGVELNTVCWFR